ncbi:MAG: radical SAM protein [Acidobacteria bacterium]|nr:radical SAM protein [Acidobacteriota bacterium]
MTQVAIDRRSTSRPTTGQWSVMFIDLVGSTELKYKEGAGVVADIITELFRIIHDEIIDGHIKFTGDGAMVIFEKDRDGALHALEAAERILQKVDGANLKFEYPRIHVRIGIATGECYEVSKVSSSPELSGKTADFAARLQGEAEVDSILVDEPTKTSSRLPAHRFVECTRRLSLKGVPPPTRDEREKFYFFKADRLLKPPKQDHYSKGLLALYPDRASLFRDLSAVRLIRLAKQGSTILVAGRTLKHWMDFGTEMRRAIREKGIMFQLLISSEGLLESDEIHRQLAAEQIRDMKHDLPEARDHFLDLVEEMSAEGKGEYLRLRETDYLILDGITCAEIAPPGSKPGDGKLIAVQDINAAPRENKATFLLACRCNAEREIRAEHCMAHGLYKRTELLFEKADECKRREASNPVKRIIRQHRESVAARNNSPSQYAGHVKKYFPLIKDEKLDDIPAPLCVQMQVSATCSTGCNMCDHWQQHHDKKLLARQLTTKQWKGVFKDVASFGVKSVIFSGGEPLMREDIDELLKSAADANLKIGLLTNGTMPHKEVEKREKVFKAIRAHVSWVAISIDGTPDEDRRIRKQIVDERCARVKEFCRELSGGPKLSATVTLQKDNISMNLKRVIEFITSKENLNIPKVNFKLATGSKQALNDKKNYEFLSPQEDVNALSEFLWNNPLTEDENNNLDYLRRCFAGDIFNISDVAEGAPVKSFYEASGLRCHTPFLFSLIDGDGDVYPCCHLFRDNHSYDLKTKIYRSAHRMGNVKHSKFSKIWNGKKYVTERARLKEINPAEPSFEPCGECTRHCQHNRVLTQIYREYEKDAGALDVLADDDLDHTPIWF